MKHKDHFAQHAFPIVLDANLVEQGERGVDLLQHINLRRADGGSIASADEASENSRQRAQRIPPAGPSQEREKKRREN